MSTAFWLTPMRFPSILKSLPNIFSPIAEKSGRHLWPPSMVNRPVGTPDYPPFCRWFLPLALDFTTENPPVSSNSFPSLYYQFSVAPAGPPPGNFPSDFSSVLTYSSFLPKFFAPNVCQCLQLIPLCASIVTLRFPSLLLLKFPSPSLCELRFPLTLPFPPPSEV